MASIQTDMLISIRGLTKRFVTRKSLLGRPLSTVNALNGIDLDIQRGETVALVGESGCGKTTVGRTLLRLVEPSEGIAMFRSRTLAAHGRKSPIDIFEADPVSMRLLRRDLQIVFQDPYSSLNPRLKIATNVAEPLRAIGIPHRQRLEKVESLLTSVGLRADHGQRYPHELSGGQRQRVAIARSIALDPQFVVADEAVSALDVSIQAQVLNLLSDIQKERGLTFLFIAHNLAAVRYVSHRIAVMYLGRIVEMGERADLFARPRHPYTEALIDAVPGLRARRTVKGEPPDPMNPPSGCPFRTRCRYAGEICASELPPLRPVTPTQSSACHFAEELVLDGVPA